MTTSVTTLRLRRALGHFATGVTVITACGEDGRLVGLTANSFNSVSLDPPLILWSLGLQARSLPIFQRCEYYAIHVLQAHQQDLAERFSSKVSDRFSSLTWKAGLGRAPILDDVSIVFECANLRQHAEGDHLLFIGQVERVQTVEHSQPLLYHGGRYFKETEIHPSR